MRDSGSGHREMFQAEENRWGDLKVSGYGRFFQAFQGLSEFVRICPGAWMWHWVLEDGMWQIAVCGMWGFCTVLYEVVVAVYVVCECSACKGTRCYQKVRPTDIAMIVHHGTSILYCPLSPPVILYHPIYDLVKYESDEDQVFHHFETGCKWEVLTVPSALVENNFFPLGVISHSASLVLAPAADTSAPCCTAFNLVYFWISVTSLFLTPGLDM